MITMHTNKCWYFIQVKHNYNILKVVTKLIIVKMEMSKEHISNALSLKKT